jgi:hypothetical protein
MKDLVETLSGGAFLFVWLAGIVLAQGWWKLLAVFPPYALYLVVEKILQLWGIV